MSTVSGQGDQAKLPYTLSFCIPTYNRAACLVEALESIAAQATDNCEIVVSDNCSTDETQSVVTDFARRFDRLRYVRHSENRGVDRNIDSAVAASSGDYCWLFSDDDLIKPGALSYVLSLLREHPSLVFTNFEIRDLTVSIFITRRWLCLDSDRVYRGHDLDRLLIELSHAVTFLSNIVIRRDIWISRDREIYYGSLFIHTGVIFQKYLPSDVIAVAEPLVTCRKGNPASIAATSTEIYLVYLPNILRKTAISHVGIAKSDIATPWRHPSFLLFLKACGMLSMNDYLSYIHPRAYLISERAISAFIAMLPRMLVSYLLTFLYYICRTPEQWPCIVKRSRDRKLPVK